MELLTTLLLITDSLAAKEQQILNYVNTCSQ